MALRSVLLLLAGLALAAMLALGIGAALMYRQLPDIGLLTDYQPKQPLRIFTSDGVEIGEFGAERRYYVPIAQIPKLMQDAVLAIEDTRFREHAGVDFKGMLRAVIANLGRTRSQGASTITQQVARTFYLSSRKTYTRKIREVLLALKIERQLSKDQVLELYMNQIFLGQRAYGFEAAAQGYFGKPMSALSIAEAAMLAGLPQNPSYANPVAHPERARRRQLLVLDRMHATGVITPEQLAAARSEQLEVRRGGAAEPALHAEHVAEMARQLVHARHGEDAYTRGIKVYTTLRAADQAAAYRALREGLLDYDRRQPYRGPEGQEDLPEGLGESDPAVAQLLADHRDDEDLRVALVTEAGPKSVVAVLASGEVVRIGTAGLRQVQRALSSGAAKELRIARGSVIRVMRADGKWSVGQWPEVQGALVALDPQTGQVRALAGGFDFSHSQFNHATQAWRQPGSSFKPFLYSAALEHGVMPATLINDAPLPADDSATMNGPQRWEPKNSDGQFHGPLTLREALALSKNLVTIRLVQWIGPEAARQWTRHFGFDLDRHPANPTLALGSGATTPMQLAGAYAVLANGGHRVEPVVIERIVGSQGEVLFEAPIRPRSESDRAIPERNAFVTASLLQEVTRSGTAARAQAELKRPDLYGKTGTTNDAVDAWFAGFHPQVAAVVWMGYDEPRSLGARESGGGLSLPIWIDYMRHALSGLPVQEPAVPGGVQQIDGDWIYDDWAAGGSVTHIGMDEPALPIVPAGPSASGASGGWLEMQRDGAEAVPR